MGGLFLIVFGLVVQPATEQFPVSKQTERCQLPTWAESEDYDSIFAGFKNYPVQGWIQYKHIELNDFSCDLSRLELCRSPFGNLSVSINFACCLSGQYFQP